MAGGLAVCVARGRWCGATYDDGEKVVPVTVKQNRPTNLVSSKPVAT